MESFFEFLFALHKVQNSKGLYYKSVLEILNSQAGYWLLGSLANLLINKISRENLVYLTVDTLQNEVKGLENEIVGILFSTLETASNAIKQCRKIIQLLKTILEKKMK